MSCHVCSRAPTSHIQYFCPICARNRLYQLHNENVRILIESESIARQIEDAVKIGNYRDVLSDKYEKLSNNNKDTQLKFWIKQTISNQQSKSFPRAKILAIQVEKLRLEIENKRLEISQRKLALKRRYSDAESAKYQLVEREAAILAGVQNSTKRTDHLWHSQHSKTAEARIFLCREAANIYGLCQVAKKKNGEFKETYCIGGVSICNLKDMNGAAPAQISTSFSYIAHLLVLVSHYLCLRLPAEISLPHRNHPTTTIYTPSKSYFARGTAFEESTSQASTSYSTSRTADVLSRSARPRPLFTDRSLPKLAKEDPATYALVLEGATLLAWNVLWLCRTQGLNLASDSWEEVCDLGKNMWQLLVAPPTQTLTLVRAFAGRDIQSRMKATKDVPRTIVQRTKSFPMLGHYSHGTVHSFLGGWEGTDFIRTWRLPTPIKVADKLKSTLLGEIASAEWELLEKKEWDDISQEIIQPHSSDKGGNHHN